ncbi:DNA-3-methyladenine glycosylase [Frondihabitans australicus]|uniref:Putative 3-methyladenine DNA glycosylase n=1 Tax=Frondihabitans australicus TaxID=386892 RepID=A0A495IGC8_9MICO|nr:DNA-3-methyladenine glycosylase [Frondihabitans australicus]RKR74458.1 DNA-3-methyladenine glycosylase [Frondihabitans australicus]
MSDAIDVLTLPALDAAPRLLGAVLRVGDVAIRLTEVEAYAGEGQDPGSHAHRGRTPRTLPMWGPPGTLYVYLSYGIHRCLNLVCEPEGRASAVLLRSGEVVDGLDVARARRASARSDAELARGPGRLGSALAVELADSGRRLGDPGFSLSLPDAPVEGSRIQRGPRVGVSGHAGTDAYDWRFFLDDPTVSAYRPAVVRRRPH